MKRADTEPQLQRNPSLKASQAGRRASTANVEAVRPLAQGDLHKLAFDMAKDAKTEGGLPLHRRVYRLKTHRRCFDVEEFIAWAHAYGPRGLHRKISREEAMRAGEQLRQTGVITHVEHGHKKFSKKVHLWRFTDNFLNHARASLLVSTEMSLDMLPVVDISLLCSDAPPQQQEKVAEPERNVVEASDESSLYVQDDVSPTLVLDNNNPTVSLEISAVTSSVQDSSTYAAIEEEGGADQSIYAVCDGAEEVLGAKATVPHRDSSNNSSAEVTSTNYAVQTVDSSDDDESDSDDDSDDDSENDDDDEEDDDSNDENLESEADEQSKELHAVVRRPSQVSAVYTTMDNETEELLGGGSHEAEDDSEEDDPNNTPTEGQPPIKQVMPPGLQLNRKLKRMRSKDLAPKSAAVPSRAAKSVPVAARDAKTEELDAVQTIADNAQEKEKKQQLSSGGIDWNARFQDLFVRFGHDEKAPNELYCLQNDFVCAATTYARLIISEMNLPSKLKTIKPVGLGGVAGGEKYIKNNILFKFALDTQIKVMDPKTGQWSAKWMYGWDSPSHKNAGKAGGRELNGIQAMFVTFAPGLHFPLMCVIDHCGYRIVAVALLPISAETLKYGSGDGGVTVHADIPALNEAMAHAGRALGLCSHRVKDKLIYGPGDIEAHLGTDGRFYVVDFARLLPPECPSEDPERRKAQPRSVFFKLLRPELVFRFKQAHDVYLCSDAFTAWGQFDPRALDMCRDVMNATRWLHGMVVPEFAQWLEATKYAREYTAIVRAQASGGGGGGYQTALDLLGKFVTGITPDLHASGINIRHLGRVRGLVDGEELKQLLLSICVARVAKNNIREQMRGLTSQQRGGTPTDEPYRKLVSDALNLLLGARGHEEAARAYWTRDVKLELDEQFEELLTSAELEPELDLRQHMDMKMFFLYLSRILGAEIDLKAIKSLWAGLSSSSSTTNTTTAFTFLQSDIVTLHPQVKKAFFANLAAGIQCLREVKQQACDDPISRRTALRRLAHARRVLHEAYTMVPSCPVVNLHCGLVTTEIAVLKGSPRCDRLFDVAYERFQKSIDIKPLDAVYGAYVHALKTHADLKRRSGLEDEARELEDRANRVETKRAEDARLALPPPKSCDGQDHH